MYEFSVKCVYYTVLISSREKELEHIYINHKYHVHVYSACTTAIVYGLAFYFLIG